MSPIKWRFMRRWSLKTSFSRVQPIDCLKSYVNGMWDLHHHLLSGLDSLVILSSFASVASSPGQSNYTTGNTFHDELAKYRLRQRENAVSLDFSMFLHEEEAAKRSSQIRSVLDLVQPGVIALLEHYCDKRHVYRIDSLIAVEMRTFLLEISSIID
ncbi:hypothetical protein ANOM_007088 [Aspergillus nomiae NRRL 13137]|uniref:Ketoreductase (KR) domain-containing protein n=1 Tax=Aspergillus nomiae NRRL (strain ATCC 15546 / NRRL 13137 / CBS 260.88 / M93) TaxID=1509407 RepID=A0A0L1IZX3_ASPN3|nr:uncharacterized protein ANOM_007088 [Aspergillus nomiae NRRL 13137]KNG85111.1 hypothetical protein ANOM_007088 [Aspergillus nomiae NRRL 13137]